MAGKKNMANRGYHLLVGKRECCGVNSRHIGGAVSTADIQKFIEDPTRCKRCERTKQGKRAVQIWRENSHQRMA
jgi:hypothetical protein